MMTAIKLFLFVLSNLGFWELLRRKTQINKYFFPSCVIVLDTSLLFVAGILNMLKEMTILLWLAGLLCLLYAVYKDHGVDFLKEYLCPGYLFCAAVMILMIGFVHGKVFAHYDDFSHWAIVVRRMIDTNRFPNFSDKIIDFQEYPLGSSVYIYFFAKLVNASEWAQMLAQIYMMTAAIMPLFFFAKRNQL